MVAFLQDYQSMGSSLHSQQEGYGGFGLRPGCLSTHSLHRIGLNGGAFHSYTPTTSQQQLKGSIQSLPDSALCAPQAVPPPPGSRSLARKMTEGTGPENDPFRAQLPQGLSPPTQSPICHAGPNGHSPTTTTASSLSNTQTTTTSYSLPTEETSADSGDFNNSDAQ